MSEPYRPPGSSPDQQGIGTAAKVLISILVLAVLAVVVGLGVGTNTLLRQWEKLTATFRDDAPEQDDVPSFDPDGPAGPGGDENRKLTAEEIFGGTETEELSVTLDEKTVHARRIGRWDRPNCDNLGNTEVLDRHGCEYAVEQALAGESGPYWTGNMILVFPDTGSAKAAVEEIDPDSMVFGFDQYERFDHVATIDSRDEFVVITTSVMDTEVLGTPDDDFSDDANMLAGFMQAEMMSYFLFR